jgi:hypothetical protein
MILSDKEHKIITDTEFLLTKNSAIVKIYNLLEEVNINLLGSIKNSNFTFDPNIDVKVGKIFKGENYNGLPYLVLDFPKLFSKSDIFSFRTMFWWGHFYSSTLHIEGKSLEKYRANIVNNISSYLDHDIYICINETPWEYNYEKYNYVLLNRDNLELFEKCKFIKLSKKFDLNQYQVLPSLSNSFLKLILDILS